MLLWLKEKNLFGEPVKEINAHKSIQDTSNSRKNRYS
jgi:hypothetical protein